MPTLVPRDRILFVDDDERLLAGLQRRLRGQFKVTTALGPDRGLAAVREGGAFAVVVADMNMPGMDGASFLAAVRELDPESVPMMLTGNTDLETATRAVNLGQVFRFISKPCAPGELETFLAAGLAHYDLLRAERRAIAAEESNRAKSEFLATVSHELRTPLTIVRSAAELLAEFGDDTPPEVRHDFVSSILTQACHLEGLIEQLLTLARLDAGLDEFVATDVELEPMVRSIAVELEIDARLRLERTDGATSPPLGHGDQRLLRRVFRELLDNARKFSPPDTPITVAIAATLHGVCVDVVDAGSGVDPRIGDAMFEPFVQCIDVLTDKPRGLGLGLTIARRFVDRHGGAISYHHDPGGGTHFVVDLPGRGLPCSQ